MDERGSATINYVTSNNQKFETIKKYLEDNNSTVTIVRVPLEIVEIQGETQEEVALDKAHKAFEELHEPVLVDDEGMFLDEYLDYPGINTKHTMNKIGYKGFSRLLPPEASHGGTFKVTFVYQDKNIIKAFEGSIHGTIVIDQSMAHDASPSFAKCFIPDGAQESYEALRGSDVFEKYYNFRATAFKKFLEWYKSYIQNYD